MNRINFVPYLTVIRFALSKDCHRSIGLRDISEKHTLYCTGVEQVCIAFVWSTG